MDTADVVAIEQSAFRAFPASEEETIGSFVCRCANPGLTRRWNSATTDPHSMSLDLTDLESIERWYVRRDRTPLIRVLSTASPSIDDQLSHLGWQPEAETLVSARKLPDRPGPSEDLPGRPGSGWLALKQRSRAMSREQVHEWLRRVTISSGSFGFAGANDAHGNVVAIGLGAVDGTWLGIFDMYVDPSDRRSGHGQRILEKLVAWGSAHGCRAAYLQVTVDNHPACGLYTSNGFIEQYRYWYRRRPSGDAR